MTTILVIEDDLDNLELMVYLFEQYGYLTVTALDGEEGIAIAKKKMPDLIVCDIKLPKLSGFEVVKILKNDKVLSTIPLVAVTAYAMVGDRDKIRASGFDGYIPKPINPAQFIFQIESFLSAKLRKSKQVNLNSSHAIQQIKNNSEKRGYALVVDNFFANRELSKNLLESVGFDVIAVQNVKEAIYAIQTKIPDLILSDFNLPDINGLDLLRLVRENEQWKSIPFIMMSATHPTEKEMQEIKKLDIKRFVLLPIDPSIFLKIVKTISPVMKKK